MLTRKRKLTEYVRGWVGYYRHANMKRFLEEIDEWLRRRIRMYMESLEKTEHENRR